MKMCVAACVLAGIAASANAQIAVSQNTNANTLAGILTGGGGLTVVSSALEYHNDAIGASGLASSGYFIAGANSYNLGASGIVLSSGAVPFYGTGPNTSTGFSTGGGIAANAADEALLDPITGAYDHYDVTRLDITIDAGASDSIIAFDVVFGSDEWAEYVGSQYVDGFGLYVNGVNYAFESGLPININHPGMQNVVETELDGVLVAANGSPKMKFVVPVHAGYNNLTFIVSDTSDSVLDTTVYIEALVPAPGSLAMVGLAGIAALRRRR